MQTGPIRPDAALPRALSRRVKCIAQAGWVILLAVTASVGSAIDNPDAPDYLARFEQRAQPYEQAIDRQTGTAAMAEANGKYAAFLERELHIAYAKLRHQLDAAARQKLEVSQRAWRTYCQAERDFIDANWTPANFGTSSALSRSQYRNALVEARIRQLLAYLKNYAVPGDAR